MATTGDGIWTPDQIDDYNLVADLATMSSTVQDALERRANAYRGTSTQRNNFTSSAPEGTIWVDTNGEKSVWVKQGNSWKKIWPLFQPPLVAIQSGSGSVDGTLALNATANVDVTFSPSLPSSPVHISLTPVGSNRPIWRVFGSSTTGFTAQARNVSGSTGSASFNWVAFIENPEA